MQAFSGGARVRESRVIVAAMLDLRNLMEPGKGGGEGREREAPCFFLQPKTHPFDRTFYSPQSSSAFKIQDDDNTVRSLKTNTSALQAM